MADKSERVVPPSKPQSAAPESLDDKAFWAVMSGLQGEQDIRAFAREFRVAPEIVAAWKDGKGVPLRELRGVYARWVRNHVGQQVTIDVAADATQAALTPEQIEALLRSQGQMR